MRAASHCFLDTGVELSSDLPSTQSTQKPASSRARSAGPAPNKNKQNPVSNSTTTTTNNNNTTVVARRASSTTRAASTRNPAPTASKYPPSVLDSKYAAALTDALASRPRAIRPALNQQQPATHSARPSVRSASDSLSPNLSSTTTRRNSINSRRTSTSPKPTAARASASASRSTSASSATSNSGRSASSTRRTSNGVSTATAPTTASAARTRRSLGASTTNTTPSTTHESRGRRSTGVSATLTASTHLTVPGSATGPLSPPLQNDALHTPATAGLVKQAPEASSRTTSNMPTDRTSQGSAASKPTVPSLSASAMRAANRGPLMPKVAGAKAPQTPTLATSAMSTPNTRRMHQATKSGSAHHYNELDSPARDATSPFPGTHITPRSGTRQVRVDSTNTTPNGTPNTDRHDGWDPLPGVVSHASSVEPPRFRRSNTSFSSIPDSPSASDSKFFHASDIKAPAARVTASSNKPQTKPATFFYANGGSVASAQSTATQSAPSLGQTPPADAQSKFLYANGVPELRPSPPLSRGSSSATSGVQPKQAPRPNSGSQAGGFAVQRPQSPVKHQTQQSMSKIQPMQPTSVPRSHVTSPQPGQGPRSSMRRTSSGTSSRVGGHSRAGSLVSGEHAIAAHRFASPQLSPHFTTEPISPLHAPSTPAPLTLASIIQAAQDIEEEEDDDDQDAELSESGSEVDPLSDVIQSPTKSSQSADPISELVANARRERKVQDLQITNASLEAINRTLERQLKKQTAEIRRFKRMSRTGRISLASAVSREDSELVEGDQVMDLSLTDLSEEDSEHGDLEEASDSDSESTSESLSPSIIAEKDARHRKKDEKRLRLDLTKHQEILVDSQKLNQSILRCMSWTEELIKEGQKALDYHVRVSDVNIRGRVLDYLDDDSHRPGHGLLRDSEIDAHLAELDDIAADLDLPSQDRDSGISVATKA